MSSEKDIREIPRELFNKLNAQHRFTLDACATHNNALLPHYHTPQGNFLNGVGIITNGVCGAQPWAGERVYCNPPFSDIGTWVKKAWVSEAELVCMLVPATRTEQAWWQELVEPFRDREDTRYSGGWRDFTVSFLPGRIHFLEDGHPIWRKNKDGSLYLNAQGETVRSSPKFGCATLTWIR